MANLQKYGSWDSGTAEQEKEESEKSGAGADFLKIKTGKNKYRILPPKIGEKSPFLVVHQHYVELPGSTSPVVFACPRMHAKKPCPSCLKADDLRDTGNPADYELAGKLLPRRRIFCNAVDRKDPERGVGILAFGKQVHEQLLALRTDEDAGGNFTDPGPDGFDVIIEKTGEGLKTEYKVFADRKTSALGNDEWLDQMHDLRRYARVPSPEELKKMLGGEPSGGSGGGMTGKPRPTGGPRRRTAADDAIDTEGQETE